MKKIIAILVCVVMAVALFAACTPATEETATEEPAATEEATEAPAEEPAEETSEEPAEEEPAGEVQTKTIGFYADGQDSYYTVMNDALAGCAALDPETDWTIDYKAGQNTADEQLKAVEDFITAGYDAIIVIQNNPNTTSECITKCVEAGIPYFGAAHSFASVANATDAAGSSCFDFVQAGKYAGEDAYARDIKKIVNIEGFLGQGSAAAQTEGLLQAYEDAGANMGGMTATEIATEKPMPADLDGSQDVEIVYWASGEWYTEKAKEVMANAITSLGADGFDGVYVHNDPMMEGVIQAMEEAGLDSADYWLGASNGREISWQWVTDKKATMDVNQPASLEGSTLFQQIKAYFAGEDYRKYIHPYLTPFNIDDIASKIDSLIPVTEVSDFLAGYEAGDFVTDINDPLFTDQANFGVAPAADDTAENTDDAGEDAAE